MPRLHMPRLSADGGCTGCWPSCRGWRPTTGPGGRRVRPVRLHRGRAGRRPRAAVPVRPAPVHARHAHRRRHRRRPGVDPLRRVLRPAAAADAGRGPGAAGRRPGGAGHARRRRRAARWPGAWPSWPGPWAWASTRRWRSRSAGARGRAGRAAGGVAAPPPGRDRVLRLRPRRVDDRGWSTRMRCSPPAASGTSRRSATRSTTSACSGSTGCATATPARHHVRAAGRAARARRLPAPARGPPGDPGAGAGGAAWVVDQYPVEEVEQVEGGRAAAGHPGRQRAGLAGAAAAAPGPRGPVVDGDAGAGRRRAARRILGRYRRGVACAVGCIDDDPSLADPAVAVPPPEPSRHRRPSRSGARNLVEWVVIIVGALLVAFWSRRSCSRPSTSRRGRCRPRSRSRTGCWSTS